MGADRLEYRDDVAPLGVLAYMGLEGWRRGAGEFALLLPLAMTAAGAMGFNRMRGRI